MFCLGEPAHRIGNPLLKSSKGGRSAAPRELPLWPLSADLEALPGSRPGGGVSGGGAALPPLAMEPDRGVLEAF